MDEVPDPSPYPEPASGRIRVRVEKDMEDVVPAYLDKRRKDLLAYRQALANHDFEAVRMLGHKMKGTGAGYGFSKLTEIGALIEEAALQQDVSRAGAAVDELGRYIEGVELEYIQ